MAVKADGRVELLRGLMEDRGIDAYLVPTSDFHESEYVGDFFKCRQYLTGFTGSSGTAVVTRTDACLWVDGRYFVQAGQQLAGTRIRIMKMGQEGVPSIGDYLEQAVKNGGVLGFDGRVVNGLMGRELEGRMKGRQAAVSSEEDLVGRIWEGRPALASEPLWVLDTAYAGQGAGEKLSQLRRDMGESGADTHILTTLDDIAWLLNLRGGDIPCNPVFLSYLMVTGTDAVLYVDRVKLDAAVRDYLKSLGVRVSDYDGIYGDVAAFRGRRVLMETAKVNYRLCALLDVSNVLVDRMNPTSVRKARKNQVEVENLRRAHIKDGVAVTRFMCWLKRNIGAVPITEVGAGRYLEQLRQRQEGYLGPSFDVISAYGEHAAICHYSATDESDIPLEPKGLYLVDSGGQYLEGTTDITRTIALGPLTQQQKEHFTLVCMGMLRLGEVRFLHGCRGLNLDYVVREPLWKRGLDFNHGTGHGVGYLLNVHERPVGLRWKMVPERDDGSILEEGMVTSDEPGVYIEGSHGVRLENMAVCRKSERTEYGQFLEFEFLTFAPIDLDAVDVDIMEPDDIRRLNAYHRKVYEKLAPMLDGGEAEWLKHATREVGGLGR